MNWTRLLGYSSVPSTYVAVWRVAQGESLGVNNTGSQPGSSLLAVSPVSHGSLGGDEDEGTTLQGCTGTQQNKAQVIDPPSLDLLGSCGWQRKLASRPSQTLTSDAASPKMETVILGWRTGLLPRRVHTSHPLPNPGHVQVPLKGPAAVDPGIGVPSNPSAPHHPCVC